MSLLPRLKGVVLDLLFPPHCIGCGKEGSLICSSCSESLPRISPPLCSKCGRPIRQGNYCPSCVRWPLVIDGIRSPFCFEDVVRQAIHSFKYQNLKGLAQPLAQFLKEYLSGNPLPVDVLIPVPLHPHRLWERGYNQSLLLVRELGALAGLPVVSDSLLRIKDAPAQVEASNIGERRDNVAGAFICQDQKLMGKRILLIDDVCTTGATLNSCAIALRKVEAASVWGLTLAREV